MARSAPEGAGGAGLPALPLERERELAIARLSEHFAHDNLTLDELERRMEAVYRAATVDALHDLTRDLPTSAAQAEERRMAAAADAFVPEHDRIVSIMAETKRRGVWRAPRKLDMWCIMSDTRLDLTEAQLTSPVTEIHLRALMAGVKIIVPPGIRVVTQPSAFMSSVTDDVLDQPPLGSGARVVRITGPVVMSELKVFVRGMESID